MWRTAKRRKRILQEREWRNRIMMRKRKRRGIGLLRRGCLSRLSRLSRRCLACRCLARLGCLRFRCLVGRLGYLLGHLFGHLFGHWSRLCRLRHPARYWSHRVEDRSVLGLLLHLHLVHYLDQYLRHLLHHLNLVHIWGYTCVASSTSSIVGVTTGFISSTVGVICQV